MLYRVTLRREFVEARAEPFDRLLRALRLHDHIWYARTRFHREPTPQAPWGSLRGDPCMSLVASGRGVYA